MKEINHLKKRLSQGRITRRDFIRNAVALGIALPTATSLSSAALAATPKKGGRLRIGITGGATSDTLDPALILDSYMIPEKSFQGLTHFRALYLAQSSDYLQYYNKA